MEALPLWIGSQALEALPRAIGPQALEALPRAIGPQALEALPRAIGPGAADALPLAVVLQAQGQPSIFNSFLIPMVMVFAIFYLLLIRPQNKQRQEHEAMQKSVEKGDEVVTTGGLHGRVTGAADEVLTLEIANLKGERVRVKVDRKSIERRTARAGGEEEKPS